MVTEVSKSIVLCKININIPENRMFLQNFHNFFFIA